MRKDAFEELAKTVDRECALIKWLPGLQLFNPASEQALDFAKSNMPILNLGQNLVSGQIRKNILMQYYLLETSLAKIIVAMLVGFHSLEKKT